MAIRARHHIPMKDLIQKMQSLVPTERHQRRLPFAILNDESDPEYGVSVDEAECSRIKDEIRNMVNVDFENVELIEAFEGALDGGHDFDTIQGIPVVWAACGGDWEYPVAFCFYLGEDGNVHGYVPPKGNTYNTKERCAFGSENDGDGFEEPEDCDWDKMRDCVVRDLR